MILDKFLTKLDKTLDGKKGSGNWGHKGRPGLRGGSLPKSKGFSISYPSEFPERTQNELTNLFNKEQDYINKLFKDGNPTCYYATEKVSKVLESLGWHVDIADGEYKDQGHWFPIFRKGYKKWVIDFGNNIDKKAIDTGKITPIIREFPNKDYKVDELMKREDFIRYIKNQ